MSTSLRENRKVQRILLEEPLRVILCSIGAEVKYELTTRNVSNTGFFLEFDSPGRFPFNQSSIMEVWMDLGDSQSIFFNGKMARVVHPTESGHESGIAIRIVQIDKENEDLLLKFVQDNTDPDGSNIVA
ncbi:PilZ domain-containing protein [Pseudobacteriovorax antillogorgiicola]|uniref:PilZ domain-containing protein n=1 Tax=Pseudobacteriovorax antillogorgiicola TaxID=1513793 RepID=A0A1Y6B278_9BACT|nr:PilZ domain-containing protein [Pseudobacteriovorax antillogorgiicola]TCS59510.1 PilZ domain-containing protein [Pseudobacteriovorax antillogorgiicola]SME87881.1 PilZ domain-containing protein [Pseudobacteriovorax antillogorgiicola]